MTSETVLLLCLETISSFFHNALSRTVTHKTCKNCHQNSKLTLFFIRGIFWNTLVSLAHFSRVPIYAPFVCQRAPYSYQDKFPYAYSFYASTRRPGKNCGYVSELQWVCACIVHLYQILEIFWFTTSGKSKLKGTIILWDKYVIVLSVIICCWEKKV